MEASNTPRLVRALRQAIAEKRGRTELEGAEAGFTLIELMVVLLIMAILLAIAIPTFLGVKSGAQDRAVQSNLTNGLTSAKAAYANSGTYSTAAGSEVAALNSAEPNITFVASSVTAGKGANSLSAMVSTDGGQLVLVGSSASGICWAAEDNESDTTGNVTSTPATLGVQYEHWTAPSTGCAANALPTTSSWGTTY